ncbi:hypothetical protein AQUCO_00600161v1 [Aquilegia coerulea]|uniref:Generative cell specific-1/HAP2 domain-containing protein n=1 Tax=Aquilegia coerulea TaxID=218851 RepID=A0A2G5EN75_AQUCA|nr:hypothetical protein AQUCO_00600161v1 [Aquilegia coerulea]
MVAKKRWKSLTIVRSFIFSLLFILSLLHNLEFVLGLQILSKSKLEKCEKVSETDTLNCTKKIVLNMAVPSGSSGGEASIVAEIVEVEENSTSQKMQTVRIPPIVTVNKSAAYAVYEITYIRDVPFKPVEYYVQTRKCEPDAGAKVVQFCERSPGKILSVTIPTFEALTQFGTAAITTKNIGKLEASYSLTFDCTRGVTLMEEQFFIMKPEEVAIRSFKLYLTTDQAAKYECAAILKDSDFNEVDRAECQFTTTATILENGSQITPFEPPKSDINGFFGPIQSLWKNLGDSFIDFFTGRICRSKCSGFFDFRCHIQYICLSWIVTPRVGRWFAEGVDPTVLVLVVLLWLLHQKGIFDPLYEWWEDHVELGKQRPVDPRHGTDGGLSYSYPHKHGRLEGRHYKVHNKQRSSHHAHHRLNRHGHLEQGTEYYHHTHDDHLHHVHRDRHKHTRRKNLGIMLHDYSEKGVLPSFKERKDSPMDEYFERRRPKKEKGHV